MHVFSELFRCVHLNTQPWVSYMYMHMYLVRRMRERWSVGPVSPERIQ